MERFVAEIPERVSWLTAQVAAGPVAVSDRLRRRSRFQPDHSPGSLVPLWRWVVPRLAPRDPDMSPIDPWKPDPDASDVPEPFRRASLWPRVSVYSLDTLILVDAVARYFGECLRQARPKSRWMLYRDEGARSQMGDTYVVHQPDGGWATPYAVMNLAKWAVDGSSNGRSDNALLSFFDIQLPVLDGISPFSEVGNG